MAAEIIIHRDDIIKEGWIVKRSKHLKSWRRRCLILTPQYLCTFKSQGEYRNPTEAIRLCECSTVKSADEDTGKENSFRVDSQGRVFSWGSSKSPVQSCTCEPVIHRKPGNLKS